MLSRSYPQFAHQSACAGVISVRDPAARARIVFSGVSELDLAVIASWREVCERRLDEVCDEFVESLFGRRTPRGIAEGQLGASALRDAVHGFLRTLVRGRVDDAYVALRVSLGGAHNRGELDPDWLAATYPRLRSVLVEAVRDGGALDAEREMFEEALRRLIRLDIWLARDAIADARRGVARIRGGEQGADVSRRLAPRRTRKTG